MAQMVKNPPALWEIWIPSLGWEDPLEKGTATHSSILAWRIPSSPWGQKGPDTTSTFTLTFTLSLVQSFSRVRLFVTPWTAACQASLSSTSS